MILELVDKQYFVFLRHLILGDAMTKLGKRVLPRYNNNIATLQQQHCHATATTLPRYRNFIVAAWQQPMFRYQTNLKEMLRLEDKSFRLEDRLADNPFLRLSASLYIANNVRVTAKMEDMVDFFQLHYLPLSNLFCSRSKFSRK